MENLSADDLKKLTYIEDCMNRILRRNAARETVFYKFAGDSTDKDPAIKEIDDKLKSISKRREDLIMVDEHMRKRGYVRKNGSLDYPRFQKDSYIDQSVWSRYETGEQDRSSHKTLLKIILALRLNESEAEQFLAYAGSGFAITDKVDLIILSYIKSDYLGDEKIDDIVEHVEFILNYYSEQEVKKGRKPLKMLYDI